MFGLKLHIVIFFIITKIYGEIVPCRFNQECQCIETLPPKPFKYDTVECSSPSLPSFAPSLNDSYSVRSFSLKSDLAKIPAGHFSAFKVIGYLELTHIGQGDQQWDENSFDQTEIRKISIFDLNGVLPPPNALRKLGQKGLKQIHVSNDRSARLEDNAFVNFTSLEALEINNTLISIIGEYAFSGLEQNLQNLAIEHTNLPRFPPIASLEKLSHVVLSSDLLKEIPVGVFSKMSNLVGLNLDNNDLGSSIEKGSLSVPANLSELSLTGNGLTSVPKYLLHVGVRSIDLSENRIAEIRSGDLEGDLNLEEINLNGNPILNIQKDAFGRLESTGGRSMKLEATNLTSLDLALCDQTPECQLYANGISTLKRLLVSDLKKAPSSLSIWLRDGGLETIDHNILSLMNQTQHFTLDIRGNRNLKCADLHWLASFHVCPPQKVLAEKAYCADKSQEFDLYMTNVFPSSKCPKVETEGHPCLHLVC